MPLSPRPVGPPQQNRTSQEPVQCACSEFFLRWGLFASLLIIWFLAALAQIQVSTTSSLRNLANVFNLTPNMKFINNSIDSEYLDESISEVDLEKHMANCEAKSELLNGHSTEKMKIPEKKPMEVVQKPTLMNGSSKSENPTKCNGKINGFYDEEEDFNLVLEDSSEGGDSPCKKTDDDSLSAPQIVQEIEDLLGINSNSAGIQEELNNLDGTESIEDNLDCVEDVEDSSQEPQRVVEGKTEECQSVDVEQIENKRDTKKSTNNTVENNECITSSHMDLVLDEVEVKFKNKESSTTNESSSIVKTECIVGSTTEANIHKDKDFSASETKATTSQENNKADINEKSRSSVENPRDEIPLSQNSAISGSSEEWMVLDSIEASEDENQEMPKAMNGLTNDKLLVQSSTSRDPNNEVISELDRINVKTDRCLSSQAIPALVEISMKTDKCSTGNKSESTLGVSEDNSTVKLVAEVKDKSEITSITPVCEGDKARKRSASVDDERLESKKPKLEEQNCLDESSVVLKRPSPIITENESKRTKLCETPDECKPLNEENHQGNGNTPKVDETCSENLETREDTEELIINVSEEKCDKDSPSLENSPKEISKTALEEEKNSLIVTPEKEQSTSSLTSFESHKTDKNEITNSVNVDDKIVNDENKENVSSCEVDESKELEVLLDKSCPITNEKPVKSNSENKVGSFPLKLGINKEEPSNSATTSNKISSSIKELEEKIAGNFNAEKFLAKSEDEKVQVSNINLKNVEPKKMTNLDFAIERVVEKARIQVEKKVPILKKFHKDQLKKLKRSELEEIVVAKICEAVSYKSELGQMRIRAQNLEETNEVWRKKFQMIDKQNNELELVLKRFLNELTHIKRENQNKVPLPVKVTRSVGLQVVLASSMHGALVASRSRLTNEGSQPQEQSAKVNKLEKENVKEQAKSSTFIPPAQSSLSKGRGRSSKTQTSQTSRSTTPQLLAPKVTPPSTPAKIGAATPVKTIQTPNKDLEVIDLTDKEEKARASQNSVGGTIRVAPSTQVCFVQQTPTTSQPQQPLYLVQKAGQRPQFLVATSTASPQRPGNNSSRPPPALALPVFRAGGHLIPMQTSPQVNVKPTNTTPTPTPTAVTRVQPALRMQPVKKEYKHPAPLPPTPVIAPKPGLKAAPPKPQLKIAKTANGIMLSWSMSLSKDIADMQSYQLYAYQEGNQPPSTGLWKKVGDVKALPLPMACTLTQFIEGHKYHFAVRAVDVHNRIGPFSSPSSILLIK